MIASCPYSEHEGMNLQPGGSMGEMSFRYNQMSARNSERIISSLRGLRFFHKLGEKRGELFCGEGEGQLLGLKVPLRNNDYIQRQFKIKLMQSEILAHHPFNTVARYCMAHLFADGQTQARAAFGLFSPAYEQDEAPSKVLPALFVTCFEFRAFEQPALLVPS